MGGYLELASARWARAAEMVDSFDRVGAMKRPTVMEQAFLLHNTYDIVKDCFTGDDRSNHRAIWLGSEQLGLEYSTGKKFFAECDHGMAIDIVLRCPDFISFPHGEGFVYFLEDASSGRIKIGFSYNPLQRADRLASIISRPLSFVGLLPGTMLTEHRFHVAFRHSRIVGEWFDASSLRRDRNLQEVFARFPAPEQVSTAHNKKSLED